MNNPYLDLTAELSLDGSDLAPGLLLLSGAGPALRGRGTVLTFVRHL